MSPEEATAKMTEAAWDIFSRFSNDELDHLLTLAGVRTMRTRDMKLHQALVVWFHGDLPNEAVIPKLVEKMKNSSST